MNIFVRVNNYFYICNVLNDLNFFTPIETLLLIKIKMHNG